MAGQIPAHAAGHGPWRPSEPAGSVTSADGTEIGYRAVGTGPGIAALPGLGDTASALIFLARALAGSFTVYLPDRRGRGMSGPGRAGHGMAAQVADLAALLRQTGTSNVLGVGAGAVIALEAALSLPEIGRLAVCDPALESAAVSQTAWLPRFESELAAGRRAAAIATVALGTQRTAFRVAPRFLVDAGAGWIERKAAAADGQPAPDLTPAIRADALLIREAAGPPDRFAGLTCDVLLMRDVKVTKSVRAAYDGLAGVLPGARTTVLASPHGPGPRAIGRAQLMAGQLRPFFAGGPDA